MSLSPRLSAGRRRTPLRLEALEIRTVPAAAIGTNVAGSGANNFAPPDTNGAIGPTHYVQMINGFYRVHTKAGALVGSVISDNLFWNNAGISTAITNTGLSDPRIIFDPLSDRWFVAEITTNNGGNNGNRILIGRSNTNNPTDGFKATSFVLNPNEFADYPTLGVDGNAVYVGTNNFDATGDSSVSFVSFPKADLLLTTPSIANRTVRTINSPQSAGGANAMGYTLQGVTNFNTGQTAASPGSIVAVDYNAFSVINRTRINGSGAAGATFGTTSHINVATTSFPGNSRQPNGTRLIDGNDDRIGTTIYQVGDLIFLTHGLSVNSSGNGVSPSGSSTNAIRITVLRDSNGTVATEKTWFNTGFDYAYPALAVNTFGDIVIGYTRSSGSQGSGATNGNLGAYALHAKIDLNNPGAGITFGQELQLRAGAVNNYSLFGGTERWGDYSATTLDPTNPTSFWTTQEYAAGSGSWGTQISQVWVSPRVTGVTTTAAPGTYSFGAVIPIQVTFNDAVTVNGTPQIALNAGGGAVANYASGSGTKTLTFNYTVGNGQQALAPNFLDYSSTAALTLNGGTIRHTAAGAANLDAELGLPTPGSAASLKPSQIAVDASTPTVTGVNSTTPNGTYGVGADVTITVAFNRAVNVTGVPQLALNSGGVADYTSGTGTNTLTFTYTAAAGDFAADLDYTATGALTGGTIVDMVSALPANRTLATPGAAGSLGANKNIAIDARLAQPADITSPTANGNYGFGAPIAITVAFTKPVTVAGVPELALNAGAGAVASYVSGTGTTTLTFAYTVGLGDLAADLDYSSTAALTLPGGATIADQASGLPAPLTLPAPGGTGSLAANKALAVDGRPAAVNNVTSPTANGTHQFGAPIAITVAFTKPVVVDTTGGVPTLALNFGGTATYTGGNGTFTSLTFGYTVGLGDFTPDLDYAATTALALNGATIQDVASNTPATLTLPAPGATGSLGANKALVIDGRPATVANVTSTLANGTYATGTVIPIRVTFTKPVTVDTVGGVPALALNSGAGGTASYTSGSGSTTLTFTYTVQGGDMAPDLDYTSTNALTLNGGAIQDQASNTPAPLGLPAPGAVGSLGANKNLVVDTTGPTVVAYRVKFGSQWFDLLTSARTNLPWKVTAVQAVFDEPVFGGRAQSLSGVTGRTPTGVGTRTLTWRLSSPLVKGTFNTALASSGPNMLKDVGGNPIVAFAQSFRVLYGDFTDDGVVNAQDELGIRSGLAAPYQPGSAGYNVFADLSGDGLVNLVDVGIARSRKGQTLP